MVPIFWHLWAQEPKWHFYKSAEDVIYYMLANTGTILFVCVIGLLVSGSHGSAGHLGLLSGLADFSRDVHHRPMGSHNCQTAGWAHKLHINEILGTRGKAKDQHQALGKELQEILMYSARFRRLKFNLDNEQLKSLADEVEILSAKDSIALFFVSAYFLRACEMLERQNLPPVSISRTIKAKINYFMNVTSIRAYRLSKYGSVLGSSTHRNLDWNRISEAVLPFQPQSFALDEGDKDEQVERIIMYKVAEAQKNYEFFRHLVRRGCEKFGSRSMHINFKIQHRGEGNKMKRVKEKLLREYIHEHGQTCTNTFLSVAQRRSVEEDWFGDILAKVYSQLQELQFVVKDLLRAKCMFPSVQHIYNASMDLVSHVGSLRQQGHQIKIVQFENRLDKLTCDVLIIVQMGQLAYEIQFVLEYSEARFEISHRMYELTRSKVFSPIVSLFYWFDKIAPEFLSRIGHLLIQDHRPLGERKLHGEMSKAGKLQNEYILLNQFFNLTSYLDLETTTVEEMEHEMEQEIIRTKEAIIEPFVIMQD